MTPRGSLEGARFLELSSRPPIERCLDVTTLDTYGNGSGTAALSE